MTDTDRRDALREADREARELAQTRFDCPLALEAGAGTGKTTALVARILAWAVGPGWEWAAGILVEGAAARGEPTPEEIAARVLDGVTAITFTEAAAAEMSTRTGQCLLELARGQVPQGVLEEALQVSTAERASRARALLAGLDQLRVSTIHAFCRRLLADHPMEAGLHPELQIDADGTAVERTVQEALEEALREGLAGEPDPDLLVLFGCGIGPPEIADTLREMLNKGFRRQDLEADPLRDEVARPLVESLREGLARLAEALGEPGGLGRAPKAREAVEAVRALAAAAAEAALGATAFATLPVALAEAGYGAARERLRDWGRGRYKPTEAKAFGARCGEISSLLSELLPVLDSLHTLDPELLQAGRRLAATLLGRVRDELRRLGVATFQDLLAEAARLLRERPAVAAWERRRIDQLLVDEFQDTDRVQCEIVRRLALEGPEEERPGLFLVGDPKQSVYGWRSADLASYDEFLSALDEGSRRHLNVNFRSVPRILDEVDRWIEPVMIEERGLQPAYQPVIPSPRNRDLPGFDAGGRAPVEVWVANPGGEDGVDWQGSAHAARLVEARAVAADIAELHSRHGVAWRDIGILLRGLGDVDLLLQALRTAGIPFRVSQDRLYYQRREVLDAVALLAAVVDPNDHLSLVAYLRSPAVGLPDAALPPLWRHGFPAAVSRLDGPDTEALRELEETVRRAAGEIPDGIPRLDLLAGWEESVLAALEALAHLRGSVREEAADLFVDRLRATTLVEATAATRYLGRFRLANLDRFFRELLAKIEENGGDFQAVLRSFRKGVSEVRQAPEGRPQVAGEDAVSVLSIHAAKGLDFEHVYLLDVGRRPPPGGGSAGGLEFAGEPSPTGATCRLFGSPTPDFHLLQAQAARTEAAERVRLLYVALTRAKQRLVVSGGWREPLQAVAPREAGSFLDLLANRPGLPAGLAAAERQAAERSGGGRAQAEGDGFRWVFPALGPEPEPAAVREEPAPAPPLAELREEARRLRELRATAAARQALGRGAPVSAEGKAEPGPELWESFSEGEPGPRREVARALGTAIHRVLEELDLAADPAAALDRQRARLSGYLEPLLPAGRLEEALDETHRLIESWTWSDWFRRLRELGPRILARELPLLLPPQEESSATGFLAGAIDLLYRDPASGELVVADFKTDRVEGEEALRARVETYLPAGRLYARAVQEALGLSEPPRFELWFLAADRIVAVPATG